MYCRRACMKLIVRHRSVRRGEGEETVQIARDRAQLPDRAGAAERAVHVAASSDARSPEHRLSHVLGSGQPVLIGKGRNVRCSFRRHANAKPIVWGSRSDHRLRAERGHRTPRPRSRILVVRLRAPTTGLRPRAGCSKTRSTFVTRQMCRIRAARASCPACRRRS